MDLAYDGTPFHGFARQPGIRTIQGEIESALARLFARPVTTACAGRTDAGVHALAQVMTTTDAPDDIDLERLRHALNGMCGPAIAVAGCRSAPDGFHARFSVRSRTYVYAVLEGDVPDPFLAHTALRHPPPLDVDAMNEAAGHLVGPHDFSSFGRVTEPDASPERTLFELRCARTGRLIRVRARANAFIQQMVRSLVGTLLEVGVGRRSPDEMPTTLRARDRAAAGRVAPAHGLCLVAVEYDEGWSAPPVLDGDGV
ncbi:MAG: tRNA pseudouridine(38-40) synthase TruA [Actinomycetota bacterium]